MGELLLLQKTNFSIMSWSLCCWFHVVWQFAISMSTAMIMLAVLSVALSHAGLLLLPCKD